MARTQLLIIDPQNDFCDLPAGAGGQPALPVTGAHADMQRLARFIDQAGDTLDAITITLDSHHRLDIAHPGFWQTAEGGAVSPFTTITASQLREGLYRPCDAAALPRTQTYLDALEAAGRYTLMVWPVHCEIGSWGHNVHTEVRAAYNRWEERRHAVASKVSKGENPWTEHYSAVQAEVPDEEDAHTRLNRGLIDALDDSDLLFIAGEASSHCVKASTEHIAEHLPGGHLGRIVLLTDCMSPVTGFEAQADGFLAAMQARGLRLMRSTEALALLNKPETV